MSINGVSARKAADNVNVTKEADGSYSYSTGFDINAFYKLLAAQISNPSMDSSEDSTDSYVNQMLQLATMESMNTMTNSMNIQTQLQNSSFAAGLVGQEVTVVEVDKNGNPITEKNEDGDEELKTTTGVVTGVSLYGDPMIYIDGKAYSLSQLMDVGKTETKTGDDAAGGEEESGTEGGGSVDETTGGTAADGGGTGQTEAASESAGNSQPAAESQTESYADPQV